MGKRQKRGRNNGHSGHKSPMEDVDPYLVELIKKLAEMSNAITTSQGVEQGQSNEKKHWRNGI